MISLKKMMTLEIRFSCEECGVWIVKKIRLKTDLKLDPTDFPHDWKVSVTDGVLRTYCPSHSAR